MPPDFLATDALPGTKAKLAVMMDRYEWRQPLFHPQDAPVPADSRVAPPARPSPHENQHDPDRQYRRWLEKVGVLLRKAATVQWTVTLPDGRILKVNARTKSEARAAAKAELKIPRKGRLPAGTKVARAA